MLEMLKYLKARYVSEKAQGIVEYALILAFVVVIAAGLFGRWIYNLSATALRQPN